MRIAYLGTPEFAVNPLEALIGNGKTVIAAICNKDKPFGRKKILTPPPVKSLAESFGIPVFQYDRIRTEGVDDLKKLNPDIMITCAFGQILSEEILSIPKYGVINIHASLLPKYRGASPIHYAVLNGETETGITIMKTDVGIDTGDIILQKTLKIGENETCGELFERLSALGAECVLEALTLIEENKAIYVKQDEKFATYTKMIVKTDAHIVWSEGVRKTLNRVRAFNPSPVAYAILDGEPFKIFSAEKSEMCGDAGKVLCSEGKIVVGTGDGAVSLLKVCKAGGKPMSAADFLRGNSLPVGTVLE